MSKRAYRRNPLTAKHRVAALPAHVLDSYDLAFPSIKAISEAYTPDQRRLVLLADEAFHAGDPSTLVAWARDYIAPTTFRASDAEATPAETVFDVPQLTLRRYMAVPEMPLYAAFRFWNRVRQWGLCIPPASAGYGVTLPGGPRRRLAAPALRERGGGGSPATAPRKLVNEYGWTQSLIPALWESWQSFSQSTQDDMGTAFEEAYGIRDAENVTVQELANMVSLFWCARSAKAAVAMSEHAKRGADPTAVWPAPTVIRIEPHKVVDADGDVDFEYNFKFNWWFQEKVTGLNGIVLVLPAACPQGDVSRYEVVSGEKRLR
jgi:hypothetical protein